jgi:predicted HTH transcriptional regulator
MYQVPPNPSFDDVEKLHRQQVPESPIPDFKRDPYANADEDKRELLRDVTSMANANGDHIVLGIREEGLVSTGSGNGMAMAAVGK